ncbi:MAG: LysR family transcriptional regulator [Hydrogenophaga sp.]|nr:LysR family transcriptional regulator [Hydrogenophaga sp.]
MRLFVAVCETRNFVHAAQRQHLVGSAVSKRMAALEAQVNTPLFVRQRHGVAPTPAGETFLEYARGMLAEAQKAEQAMAAYASGVRGQVRLLATASVMSESLADDIVEFMRLPAHAGIKVDVEERFSPDVARGVREGHATLGITWDTVDLQGLKTTVYRTDHLGMVVPAGHPLSRLRKVDFAQTLAWEQVSLPSTSAVQVLLERAAAQSGHSFQSRAMVSNFEAGLRMARSGLAICVVPLEIFRTSQSTAPLKWIGLKDEWATRKFLLCHRQRDQLSAAAQLLVEHLQASSASTA